MKIAFHANQLSLRGTEVAMYDYAFYNKEYYGNDCIILTKDPSIWKYSHMQAIEKFQKKFQIYFYKDAKEIQKIIEKNNIDLFYAIKSGRKDGIEVKNIKNCIHAVFQDYEPHGDVYAYISEWLGKKYNSKFVPFIVDLPKLNENLREYLGIPKNAIVFGRYGGFETFDIDYVKKTIIDITNKRKDIYFIFMYTEKFTNESNRQVLYLEENADLHLKSKFINTCDAMLHARERGESFGLAIGEFSFLGKPIITCLNCGDRAHIEILGSNAFYYKNQNEIEQIINDFKKPEKPIYTSYSLYSPQNVMQKFKDVFLS